MVTPNTSASVPDVRATQDDLKSSARDILPMNLTQERINTQCTQITREKNQDMKTSAVQLSKLNFRTPLVEIMVMSWVCNVCRD